LLQLEDRLTPAGNGHLGFAVGANDGSASSQVQVYDTAGTLIVAFNPFPGFAIGAHVAVGDMNGDGVPDLIVGAGFGGGPQVVVYDGAGLQLGGSSADTAIQNPLKSFYAYNPSFHGGVNVAVGNIFGQADPLAPTLPDMDIVTGAGPGGTPQVNVIRFRDLMNLNAFYGYDINLRGGVNVAAGNVGGDTGQPGVHPLPSDDLVTGPGVGGGPHVKVYAVSITTGANSTVLDLVGQYFAYNPHFYGGISVAVGIITNSRDMQPAPNTVPPGNLYADIITGPGPGVSPDVITWRLDNGNNVGGDSLFTFLQASSFYAYSPGFTGGVNVGATGPISTPGQTVVTNFITGPMSAGGPQITLFSGDNFVTSFGTPSNPNGDTNTYQPLNLFTTYAFDKTYTGGVTVS
jgi:hypothetical protein